MTNSRVQAVARLLHRTVGHNHTAFQQGMVARTRKPVISTQAVDFKVQHTAKSKQSWRYPGGNIVRHAEHTINGTKYTDHKDPGENRRKQESNFFLTINTNKSPESQADIDRCVGALERTLKALSADPAIASYLKFGPKHPEHYGKDKYNDVVHSVSWKANVEVGDSLKRVHAHVWMTVTHYSQVQINVHALMALARLEYNKDFPQFHDILRMNDMPYVHVKLLPQSDWTDVMRQYIHKAMSGA